MKEKDYIKYINQDSWFHGTTLKSLENIRSIGIKADYNRGYELDFGYGFYLAPHFNQAGNYIKRMLPYLKDKDALPVVIEFDLNVNSLIKQGYKYKTFLHLDREFAEFVTNCRLNPDIKTHDFDFIIGTMSDSNPVALIKAYKDGIIQLEELYDGLTKWNSFQSTTK